MRARIIPVLVAGALALAGCGGDGDDSERSPASSSPTAAASAVPTSTNAGGAPNLLTDAQVARQPKGSPARAVFEFFQAVQYRDVSTALSLVSKAEKSRVGPTRLRGAIINVGSLLGRPQFVSVRHTGVESVVRVLIQGYEGNDPDPVVTTPAAFPVIRQDGLKLDDVSYLLKASADLSAARKG